MKRIFIIIMALTILIFSCKKHHSFPPPDNTPKGWSRLGGAFPLSYVNDYIFSIAVDKNDKVYAAPGYDAHWNPIVFDGTSWTKIGNLNADSEGATIAVDDAGNVYTAGYFVSGTGISNPQGWEMVAKYNGGTWSKLGGNGDSSVSYSTGYLTFALCPSGTLYANLLGFGLSGPSHRIAKMGATTTESQPVSFTDPSVGFIQMDHIGAADASCNVYGVGSTTSGSWKVCSYNGTIWKNLGFPETVTGGISIGAMTCDKSGNFYIAYAASASSPFKVAKWNGTTWTILNGLNANGFVYALAVAPNGHVFAGGNFKNAGGNQYVAEWNGTAWSEVGGLNANGSIEALAVDSRGYVYAGGTFTNTSGEAYIAIYKP